MHRIAGLLALRYLTSNKKEKTLKKMALVCFLGIFIGSFSLALVTCIMTGFEKITHQKLRSIHPQIIMRSSAGSLNFNKIESVLTKEFPAIAACAPTSTQQLLIHAKNAQTHVIMLKAIDTEKERALGTLSKKIEPNEHALYRLSEQNSIIIGVKLAQEMHLAIGDTIDLWYNQEETAERTLDLQSTAAVIVGFFKTGIDDFDNGLALCSFKTFHELFPQVGIERIEINLFDNQPEAEIITALKKRFPLDVFSWKDLYPALVSALKLEKYVMFIILALITLVASMNIVSLLFMYISYKRTDIALLKTLGVTQQIIARLFFIIGSIISLSACLLGLLTAFLCGLILDHYPFIELPDTYYASHLPISLDLNTFILVFIVIMLISYIAIRYSVKNCSDIHIAGLLKGDS